MYRLIAVFAVMFGLSIVLSSCNKEETGNAKLNFSAEVKSAPFIVKNNQASLEFNSGYVWVSEIVFDADMVGGPSISKTIERFSKIDFATGIANPSFDDVIIPAGEYNSVNLGVELRDEDNQPSIIMEGTYTRTDGSSSPIEFRFNSGEVFEAEAESATVAEDELAIARIVFDPEVWFSVISANRLDNANVNGEGKIVISESSNSAIFDDVADRLDVSTEASFN